MSLSFRSGKGAGKAELTLWAVMAVSFHFHLNGLPPAFNGNWLLRRQDVMLLSESEEGYHASHSWWGAQLILAESVKGLGGGSYLTEHYCWRSKLMKPHKKNLSSAFALPGDWLPPLSQPIWPHGPIILRLDYWNTLYMGLLLETSAKLWLVQNIRRQVYCTYYTYSAVTHLVASSFPRSVQHAGYFW